MSYIRKTKDIFLLFADYGQGWEIETKEKTLQDLKKQKRVYLDNAPQYNYKCVIKRVRI